MWVCEITVLHIGQREHELETDALPTYCAAQPPHRHTWKQGMSTVSLGASIHTEHTLIVGGGGVVVLVVVLEEEAEELDDVLVLETSDGLGLAIDITSIPASWAGALAIVGGEGGGTTTS